MELYIHAGLNKTGSSYLQELFYANQNTLQRQGYVYCTQGKGANAAAFSHALRQSSAPELKKLLSSHIAAAKQQGVTRILLSSETLYHDLIVPERRSLLKKAAHDAGITDLHVLLFFRHPIAHAISAFCGRSIALGTLTFSQWMSHNYEFPKELRLFLTAYDEESKIKWKLCGYEGKHLKKEASKWLGVSELKEPEREKVNVSITTTEARLMTMIPHQNNILRAGELQKQLQQIPRSKKADDRETRELYEQVAAIILQPYQNDLRRLSDLVGIPMTAEETSMALEQVDENVNITLSADQAKALMAFMIDLPDYNLKTLWKNRKLKKRVRHHYTT